MAADLKKHADALALSFYKVKPNKWRNLLLERSYVFATFFANLKPDPATGTHYEFKTMIKGGRPDDVDATVSGMGVYNGSDDTVPIKVAQHMVSGHVPWSAMVAGWGITDKDKQINAGKEGFANVADEKMEAVLTEFAETIEYIFWSRDGYKHESAEAPWLLGPEYAITDDGYHINDAAGASGTKVYDIDPTNAEYNDKAGVNRWRNHVETVTSANDLLDGMSTLFRKCHFRAPPNVKLNTKPEWSRFRIVFDEDGFEAWEKLMKRLGEPFDPADPTWKNTKVEWSDGIVARSADGIGGRTADGYNQGFFFNLAGWRSFVPTDKNFAREPKDKAERLAGQPSAYGQYIKFWPCLVCENRRTQGKILLTTNELA